MFDVVDKPMWSDDEDGDGDDLDSYTKQQEIDGEKSDYGDFNEEGAVKQKIQEKYFSQKRIKKEKVDSELERDDVTWESVFGSETADLSWESLFGTKGATSDDDRSEVELLIESLKKFPDIESSYVLNEGSPILNRVDGVLYHIFCIGEDCSAFSDEQKQNIGTLLLKLACGPLKLFVKKSAHKYTGRNPFVLQHRSALEYLKTYYLKFLPKDTALSCKLQQDITESMKILDENIRLFRNMISSFWGDFDFELYGGSYVPDTHTWWPKEYPLKMVKVVTSSGSLSFHGIYRMPSESL